MSHSPFAHSADLRRLAAEGHVLELGGGRLTVRGVPFLDGNGIARSGSLIVPLTMSGERTAAPSGHIAWFVGGTPCDDQGRPIAALGAHVANHLGAGPGEGLALCMRPNGREYIDYHEFVTCFLGVISAPVGEIGRGRRPPVAPSSGGTAPFAYSDTATARAGTGAEAERLAGRRIGVVGLGGTGSYILDLLAKTPVAEIRIFDADRMMQHNAFRAPGAASLAQLRRAPYKVDHHAATYGSMHVGIVPHRVHIDAGNFHLLAGLDFVFVCVDQGAARLAVAAALQNMGIPFIDTGMGLERSDRGLVGSIRVTTGLGAEGDAGDAEWQLPSRSVGDDDPYATNIQVAELNAIAAALAVIRWKRWCGFYADTGLETVSVYAIDGNQIVNERSRKPTTDDRGTD